MKFVLGVCMVFLAFGSSAARAGLLKSELSKDGLKTGTLGGLYCQDLSGVYSGKCIVETSGEKDLSFAIKAEILQTGCTQVRLNSEVQGVQNSEDLLVREIQNPMSSDDRNSSEDVGSGWRSAAFDESTGALILAGSSAGKAEGEVIVTNESGQIYLKKNKLHQKLVTTVKQLGGKTLLQSTVSCILSK